jgi:recombination protein RecA
MSSKAFEALLKDFSKVNEAFSVKPATSIDNANLEVISTGSVALDDALSCGGYPKGRLIQLYGEAASGKSLLAMLAIKEAQKVDADAWQLFIDAEQTFDPNWAETLGVDTSRVKIFDGEVATWAKEVFEFLTGTPKKDAKNNYVGKAQDGLLDLIAKKEENCNLIILDSMGCLRTPTELISEVGKQNMALLARFMSNEIKKLAVEVGKANIPFIMINHIKASMDMYKDHTYSGGNSYSHHLSANIFISPAGGKDNLIFDEDENKVGGLIRAKIEKSKFGPHPRQCEYRVHFGVGIVDRGEELITLASKYNVIERPNNTSYVYGDKKWVGRANAGAALEGDEELSAEILEKVKVARKKKLAETGKKYIGADVPAANPDTSVEGDEENVAEEEKSEKKTRKKK